MVGGRGVVEGAILPPLEAKRILQDPAALEAYSPFGTGVFAVDLRGASDSADFAASDGLAAVTAVTVALTDPSASSERVRGFDCHVVDETELALVCAAVCRRPLASIALVQLLRGASSRTIEAGLVAESWVYSMLQAGPEFAAWQASRAPRTGKEETAPPLRAFREGDSLRLTFSRPRKRNAVSVALRDALNEAFVLAAMDDQLREIVVSGEGPVFCSGGDLDEFGSFSDVVSAHAVRTTRSPARAAARIANRLEFRVHGSCAGAGVEWPAFASRVIAARDTTFRLPEVEMGLIPGAGGTVSLPLRIGAKRTAWLALTGIAIDADTALAWGLVDAIA